MQRQGSRRSRIGSQVRTVDGGHERLHLLKKPHFRRFDGKVQYFFYQRALGRGKGCQNELGKILMRLGFSNTHAQASKAVMA